jgi:hypothetical protein
MSNQPETPSGLQLERPWEPDSGKGTLNDYMDDFCLPLYGVMPEKDIRQFRFLAEEHILDLIEEFQGRGLSSHSALHAALREHGDPHLIGKLLRNEWRGDRKTCVGSLAFHVSAKRTALFFSLLYLCLALAMWLVSHDIAVRILALLVSPVPVGGVVGTVEYCRLRRPILWVSIMVLYPILLTGLILALWFDISSAMVLMPLWAMAILPGAGATRSYWQGRRMREFYRHYYA